MTTVSFAFGQPLPKWVFGELTTTTGMQGGQGGGQVIQTVLSTEYIQVAVTAVAAGAIYNPTADVIQFAFTTIGTNPGLSDWHTGSWTTALATGTYLAQCLVGPGVGGVSLAAGTYAVWVKITDNPEIPVEQVGVIQIV